jgi:hypothetical protein
MPLALVFDFIYITKRHAVDMFQRSVCIIFILKINGELHIPVLFISQLSTTNALALNMKQ